MIEVLKRAACAYIFQYTTQTRTKRQQEGMRNKKMLSNSDE